MKKHVSLAEIVLRDHSYRPQSQYLHFWQRTPLFVWRWRAGRSSMVSSNPSTNKNSSSILSFIVSSPRTSTLKSPMCICLCLTVPIFLDVSVWSCTGRWPWWLPRGACHPINPDTTPHLLLLDSDAWAEAEGIFCWASNKRKNCCAHGGTSLWVAPDWSLEWRWS